MRDRFSRASCFPKGQSSVRPSIRSSFAPERRATFATIFCSRILIDHGLAQVDDIGVGLKVERLSRLIDAFGAKQPDLFAFGPITRGTFGEMTGAPDILRHIEHVVPTLIEPREQMRTNGLKTLAS